MVAELNRDPSSDNSVSFEALQERAVEISDRYDELNRTQLGLVWSDQDVMSGFVSDVGGLSKAVMARNGLRTMDDVDARLEHKLADCLWSVFVLAKKFDVPLARVFMRTMDELDERIGSELEV